MGSDNIAKHVYLHGKSRMHEKLWWSNVKLICDCLDMGENFQNDLPISISHAKKVLLHDYNQAWAVALMEKPKLTLHSTVKQTMEAESYLNSNICKY